MNKIIISKKVFHGKKDFVYFIGFKDAKKQNLYVYFSPKWVHIEATLMKLNKIFLNKWW